MRPVTMPRRCHSRPAEGKAGALHDARHFHHRGAAFRSEPFHRRRSCDVHVRAAIHRASNAHSAAVRVAMHASSAHPEARIGAPGWRRGGGRMIELPIIRAGRQAAWFVSGAQVRNGGGETQSMQQTTSTGSIPGAVLDDFPMIQAWLAFELDAPDAVARKTLKRETKMCCATVPRLASSIPVMPSSSTERAAVELDGALETR
jgi:hypothetical protein